MTSRAKQGGGYQDWGQLRSHLTDAYNEAPHPATEQDIIDAYELHPDAVEKAALALIGDNDVRSPWGVLRSRATKLSTPLSNPTRSSSLEREKAIGRAEQWIRNAGLHYDNETELLLELFDGGLLSTYAQTSLISTNPDGGPPWMIAPITGDQALAERMLTVYRQHRPTGITLEQDADDRATKWKREQTARAQALAAAKTELEATITEREPVLAGHPDDLPL